MSFSIQQKLSIAFAQSQKKLFDTNIQSLGTGVNTILLDITEDMYGDESIEIIENKEIFVYINFPNNEVPLPQDSNSNVDSGNTLHLYDILPITANFKFSDNVKKGNVFFHKIKIAEGNYAVVPYQCLEAIGQSTITDIVYVEWNVSPITNFELANSSAYQTLYNNFKDNNNWDVT